MDNTPFHEFLTELLKEGKIVFRSAKAPHDRISPPAVAFLAEAFKIIQRCRGRPAHRIRRRDRLRGRRVSPAIKLGPGQSR